MYVLDVIPLSRSAPPGSLSYRSTTKLALGSIVSISLRKQHVRGVVIATRTVAEAKAQLKTASFLLSKSVEVTGERLPHTLFQAVSDIAAYHAAPLGVVLASLLSDAIVDGIPPLRAGEGHVIHRCESSTLTRMQAYEAYIQETLARKRTALLILPTIAELEQAKQHFAAYTPLILSSSPPRKKRDLALADAPGYVGLILATPSYAWTPIQKLGLIVLERPSAGSYVQLKRPYIDMRVAAEALAQARAIPFVLGDYPLPLEFRANPSSPLNASPSSRKVIDSRRKEQQDTWEVIPTACVEKMSQTLQKGGRVLLLAVRKGYAPVVVCRDCGTAVTDERGRTLSFAKAKGKNVFRSSDGTEVAATHTKCAVCDSWNLFPLGIGVERVYEEALRLFPDAQVISFDATTPAQAKRILAAAHAPGTILVGTEHMLAWLPPESQVQLGVIVSADTLLALPFWRARERFVRIAHLTAERCEMTYIATRHPEDTALEAVSDPQKTTFFAEEAALRKALGYPPYGTLLHFSAEGERERLDAALERIKTILPVTPLTYQQVPRGALRMSAVAQVRTWPDAALSATLSTLPPWIRVRIDTESLW